MPLITEDTTNCPLCHTKGELFQKNSQLHFGQQFDIYSCPECAICYTSPTPSDDLLTKIYSGEPWLREKKTDTKKKITGIIQKFNHARLAVMVRPLIKRLKSGARILEVGCGSGQLAIYLQQHGFNIEVTDVSQEVPSEIFERHKILGYCGDLQNISFEKVPEYDAIIFNNVLEHLYEPGKKFTKGRPAS